MVLWGLVKVVVLPKKYMGILAIFWLWDCFSWEIWVDVYYLHWMLGLPMFPSIAANAGMRLYQVEYDGIYSTINGLIFSQWIGLFKNV